MNMLWLACTFLFVALSSAERLLKQPRHSSHPANLADVHRRSSRSPNQMISASQFSDFGGTQETELGLESDNNYDLLHMQELAASLVDSFEDMRRQLYSNDQKFVQPTDEREELRDAVATNIASLSLALENIRMLLGIHSKASNNSMEGLEVENLSVLLHSGEKERSKLRGRLMQLKKQWPPPLTTDALAIDLTTPKAHENEISGLHLRQLLPESLLQQIQDYDDQSLLALPPSHFASGLLSDTGHEDINLPERQEDRLIAEDQPTDEDLITEDHGVEYQSNQQRRQQITPLLSGEQSFINHQLTETPVDASVSFAGSYSISTLCFSAIVFIFLFSS